jgi:hypothetical protein
MYVVVLLSAPTMVKTQSIHRAIHIIMNHRVLTLKRTTSKRGPFLTQIVASDKLREVKKLREKRIEGVRDRLKELGIQWNPHAILS